MPAFRYKGVDSAGKRVSGTIDGDSQSTAMAALAQRGCQVFELRQHGGAAIPPVNDNGTASSGSSFFADLGNSPLFSSTASKRIGQADLLLSIQELSTLLEAGVSLADAVENIARGYDGTALGRALDQVYAALRSGAGIARALEGSHLQLPGYVHELVRAGEETGRLFESLRSAASQMEADARFRREARNALTYPLLLMISGLIATLVVFVFVVPKFANLLTNPKADLPLISVWVLQSGLWLVTNKLLATVIAITSIGLLVFVLAQPLTRVKLWEAAAGAPLLGRWIHHVEIARWGGMLAVLLGHHVPLLEALAHSQNSLTGKNWRRKAELVVADVRGGKSLAAALQTHHFVDAIGVNLVRVGERSGALSKTVSSLADMHRASSEQSLKQFLVLLEPLTILLVSVLLGGIMISVMLAITSLTNLV